MGGSGGYGKGEDPFFRKVCLLTLGFILALRWLKSLSSVTCAADQPDERRDDSHDRHDDETSYVHRFAAFVVLAALCLWWRAVPFSDLFVLGRASGSFLVPLPRPTRLGTEILDQNAVAFATSLWSMISVPDREGSG